MIILSKEKKVLKISFVSGREEKATMMDVFEYFEYEIDSKKIDNLKYRPILFKGSRIIYRNVEVKDTNELFNLYMNLIRKSEYIKNYKN